MPPGMLPGMVKHLLRRPRGVALLLAATLVATVVAATTRPTPARAAASTLAADVIGRNATSGDLVLYKGDGLGGFVGSARIGTGWSNLDTVFSPGDFTGNHTSDIVGRARSTNDLLLYEGNGLGGFSGSPRVIGTSWGNFDLVFSGGNFDGRGGPDILARHATNHDLYLYSGNGFGGFYGPPTVIGTGWGNFDTIFSPGDFTGDGRADLFARHTSTRDLYLYRGNGSGGFTGSPTIFNNWGNFDAIFSPGDFNGDGKSDVPARSTANQDLYLYKGNGSGAFSGSALAGSNWAAFDLLFSPGNFNVEIPARTDGLNKPVYFIHGYKDTDDGWDVASYWADYIDDFRFDGNPALLTGPVLLFCYYANDRNCGVVWFGDRSDSIKTVGQQLAWDIYNRYSRFGIAVDAVGHSMGGLVVAAAITGVQKHEAGFPPFLFIEDVAAISSPMGGLRPALGVLCYFAPPSIQQCKDMVQGSDFMNWLSRNPQSTSGTDWTLIGSHDDVVVPASQAVPDNLTVVGHRVIYAEDEISGNAHMTILDAVSGGYDFRFCDYFNASCAGSGESTFAVATNSLDPSKMARYAIMFASAY